MIEDPAAQEICRRCGAWLPVRPDFSEFASYIRERPDPHCRHRPPDREVWSPFTIDNFYCDRCVIEEPIEEWRYRFSCLECGWPRERTDKRGPTQLFPSDLRERSPAGEQAHRESWQLPRTLIVQVNYAAARHCHVVGDSELAGLPSLLDHGGRRVAHWGSVYEDDFGDPRKVRFALARLRHARRDGDDAKAAWLLCERAVLAVNLLYAREGLLARRLGEDALPVPFEVAPVHGGGALSIQGRYDAWMAIHHGYPWLFDPAEEWHDRMRRRFAGLPDPVILKADVPQHLRSLWQFVGVADDLEHLAHSSRGEAACEREDAGIRLRAEVFKALCAKGELDRRLPYRLAVREPGYVPEYQQGCEAHCI
jgi:hypothetical protein